MKKNIIPDIDLQNEIQKNKILNSRDFYKGKSFRFAHEWHDGITYFNDEFYTDFVVYKNVLLACKNRIDVLKLKEMRRKIILEGGKVKKCR